ncbi:MAG: TVP38/TMEM64 family protein [Anaerolineae bacterium]
MKNTITRFLPLAILIILIGVVYFTGLYRFFSFENLKQEHQNLKSFAEQHKILMPLLFMLVYAISTTLSIPGGLFLSVFGGFLFPQPFSTLYVVIGATCGASTIFLIVKTSLGDLLRPKIEQYLTKMSKGFEENAISYLLFLRFVPLFPFWAVNIAPAFFHVRFRTFIWTTFIGILPGAFVFTQAGVGLGAIFETDQSFSLGTFFNFQIKIALIALGLFALLPILIKKLRKKPSS